MKSNFEYVDHLPPVPADLLDEILKADQNPNLFDYTEHPNYQLHQCTRPINVWMHPLFDFKHVTGVQYLRNNIDIHVDFNRDIAYNYIIDTGGNKVATCFYNEHNELTEYHIIEAGRWHKLNVSVPHSVEGIEPDRTRIAITVWPRPEGR